MNVRRKELVTLLVVGFVVAGTVPAPALGAGPSELGSFAPGTTSESPRGAAPSVQSAAAQQVTDCTTIDTPGLYVLAGDIVRDEPPEQQTTCIDITSSDVVFDGNGSEMRGNITTDYPEGIDPVTGGVAIRAVGVSNVTVRNVELRSWKYGVRFESVANSDIQIQGRDYAGPSAVDSENITLHDSLLRSATVDFEADHVVVRRNDIDADPNGDFYADAIRVEGADTVIVNNTIDPGPTGGNSPDSYGLVLTGNESRVQGNLFRTRPTRENPNPGPSGAGFVIKGDDNVISNNTLKVSRLRSSIIRGDRNLFSHNNQDAENTRLGLRVDGDGNTLTRSVFHDHVSVGGSDNIVTNVSISPEAVVGSFIVEGANNTVADVSAERLSISGTNSTLSDSEATGIRGEANATAVRNAADDISGSFASIVNNNVSGTISSSSGGSVSSNTMSQLLLRGTNISLRNNTIREKITLERAENLALRNGSVPTIELTDSRNNSISGYTAENITLRSISDHNTITRSTVGRIQIVDDSRNNTVRNNDAGIRVAGETSFDNLVVDNNASGADTGIELDRARRTLVLNNTVTDNGRGIVLDGASDNRLLNNTATGNSGPAYRSSNGSVNNTVTNLTLGPTVSFRSRDVALDVEPSPPDSPAGLTDVGVFLEATNTSADSWLNLTTHYAESDTAYVEEETLRLWRYAGSWAEVPGFNRVDTTENVVESNVSGDAFGVLAPLGNATDTTPPTISDYDVRTPDDETLVVEFNASEPLSEIHAVVTNASGAEVARLNESDFTESGADPYAYTGTVALPNGTYTATIETAADAVGNDGASGQSDTVTIGVAAVQLSLSANRTTVDPGDTVEFTVTRADTDDPVNATVRTGDRSVVTGENGRANVSFPDSGTFEVTATKADTDTERFRNDTVEVTVGSPPPAGRARVAVDPTSETVVAGESFRVAVTYNATAADEVYGVQFTLEYDTSLLNATNVTKGSYLGPEADTLVVNSSIDDADGRVRYGESRRTDGGVSGNGTLAYVEFTVADRPDTASVRTNLSFTEVKASDPNGQPIETEGENGSVRIERNRPPALSAALSFAVNNVGSPVRVGVDASDDTAVMDVRLLAPDGAETDALSCGTPACNGTVSDTPTTSSWNDSAGAYDRVSYRVVATDDQGANTTETLQTALYIAGDASGDGLVDIVDAVGVGRSWTCTADDPCYSDAGDLNNDGVVDIFDAVVIGRNWQETAGA